jgi:hypothetical protein
MHSVAKMHKLNCSLSKLFALVMSDLSKARAWSLGLHVQQLVEWRYCSRAKYVDRRCVLRTR